MKKSLFIPVLLLAWASAPAAEINSTYTGPNNGLWSDPANWSPAMVPMNNGIDTYNVTNNLNRIIRLDIDPTISHLTLGGSTARVFGTDHGLTVSGTTNINPGSRIDVVSQSLPAVKFNLGTLADFDSATNTLLEGGYFITAAPGTTSTLQFNGANIVTNSARLGIIGAGASIKDQLGNNALVNLTRNTNFIRFADGATFTTANNFINEGWFVARPGSTATFNGSFTSTIAAVDPGETTGLVEIIATDSGGPGNSGNALCTLNSSLANFSGGTLSGGRFNILSNGTATSTLRFAGADIVDNGAFIELFGANSGIRDENGNDGLRNLAAVSGRLTLARHSMTTAGALHNTGELIALGGTTLNVGGVLTNEAFMVVSLYDIFNDVSAGLPGFDPDPAGVLNSTVSIGGNLALGADSFLIFEVHSEAVPATVEVSGSATLNGDLFLGFALDDSAITSADTLTLIQASGGITGAFNNVANGERLDAFFYDATEPAGSFVVNYSANSVTLSDYQRALPAELRNISTRLHVQTGDNARHRRLHHRGHRFQAGAAARDRTLDERE